MSLTYEDCIIEQPLINTGLVSNLPEYVLRKCCPGKSCGNTYLYLNVTPSGDYEYRRASNDEVFFSARSISGLCDKLNSRRYWPIDLYLREQYWKEQGLL